MNTLSPGENAVLGTVVGMQVLVVVQPMLFWKNAVQQRLPFTADPRKVYRGLGASVAAQVRCRPSVVAEKTCTACGCFTVPVVHGPLWQFCVPLLDSPSCGLRLHFPTWLNLRRSSRALSSSPRASSRTP
jgi:hypothetical protein